MKEQFSNFTPNVPVETDSHGRRIQRVNGEVRVLHPIEAQNIEDWQRAGLDDEEILDWLSVT